MCTHPASADFYLCTHRTCIPTVPYDFSLIFIYLTYHSRFYITFVLTMLAYSSYEVIFMYVLIGRGSLSPFTRQPARQLGLNRESPVWCLRSCHLQGVTPFSSLSPPEIPNPISYQSSGYCLFILYLRVHD